MTGMLQVLLGYCRFTGLRYCGIGAVYDIIITALSNCFGMKNSLDKCGMEMEKTVCLTGWENCRYAF